MELLIIIFISLFFLGAVSFLKPSKKMKVLSKIRSVASKEGFKIGSTAELRNKFKKWDPRVAIYQLKNTSSLKELHYIKENNVLRLYAPTSIKYDENFKEIESKISALPNSVLEIIFFQSNIAIVWDEMLGVDELSRIKEAILKI